MFSKLKSKILENWLGEGKLSVTTNPYPLSQKKRNRTWFRKSGLFFTIASIAGIIFAIFSVVFYASNIHAKKTKVILILSDYTKYAKGGNGDRDTFFLAAKQQYLEEIRSHDKISYLREIEAKTIDSTKTINYPYFIKNPGSESNFVKTIKIQEYNYVLEKIKPPSKDSLIIVRSKYFKDIGFTFKDTVINDKVLEALVTEIHNRDKPYEAYEWCKEFFYNKNPGLLVWLVLMSCVNGFSVFLVFLCIAYCMQLEHKLLKGTIGINIFLAFILVFLLVFPQLIGGKLGLKTSMVIPKEIEPLLNFGIEPILLDFNFSFPFLGILLWLVLIFFLNTIITKKSLNYKKNSDPDPLCDNINKYQQDFELSFILIAIYLAITLISNGVLMSAFEKLLNSPPRVPFFPLEFSAINGLFQTFVLLLLYLSISLNFFNIKRNVVEKSGAKEKVTARFIKKGIIDYLKIILAILAPLLGGGLQELVEAFFN